MFSCASLFIGLAFQLIDDCLDGDGYLKIIPEAEAHQKARDLIAHAKREIHHLGKKGEKLVTLADYLLKRLPVKKNGKVYVYINSCPHIGVTLDWEEDKFLDSSKSMIQCARMAFGFGGIHDQDEAERIVEASPVIKTIDPATGEITSRATPSKLPNYSDEDFEKNLPAWQRLIESGKKTAIEIIAMVSTKGTLSPEQIAMIEAAENIIQG